MPGEKEGECLALPDRLYFLRRSHLEPFADSETVKRLVKDSVIVAETRMSGLCDRQTESAGRLQRLFRRVCD